MRTAGSKRGQCRERIDPDGPQCFALVDVADARGNRLIEQGHADRRCGVESFQAPRDHIVVGARQAQVGTEGSEPRVPCEPIRIEQLHHRRVEADGVRVRGRDRHHHPPAGTTPPLSRSIGVPGARHLQVRVQGRTARESDQQVLAASLDRSDAFARGRRLVRPGHGVGPASSNRTSGSASITERNVAAVRWMVSPSGMAALSGTTHPGG